MTRLEEADEARALAIDLQTLQARVNGIETRLEKTRQVASASRPRAPVATKPKVPEPPFRVLGMELRGGERFLSITSTAAGSLAGRPEARRVGKACVGTCRSRGWPDH